MLTAIAAGCRATVAALAGRAALVLVWRASVLVVLVVVIVLGAAVVALAALGCGSAVASCCN